MQVAQLTNQDGQLDGQRDAELELLVGQAGQEEEQEEAEGGGGGEEEEGGAGGQEAEGDRRRWVKESHSVTYFVYFSGGWRASPILT